MDKVAPLLLSDWRHETFFLQGDLSWLSVKEKRKVKAMDVWPLKQEDGDREEGKVRSSADAGQGLLLLLEVESS